MDHRIQFPPTKIDFTSVGVTGQAHDSFPAGGAQPRFDWFRMYLIGLLANQSSENPPTQYRDGTIWFDLTTLQFKVHSSGQWLPLSDTIRLSDTETLSSWFESAEIKLTSLTPEITFSGVALNDNTTEIDVPQSLQASIDVQKARPMVFINGLMQDPRNTEFQTASTIKLLSGVHLDTDDKFTVLIRSFATGLFHIPTVSV